MKKPFSWDHYSDQAALLQDKAYKKKMRKKEWRSLLKTLFIAAFTLPIAWILLPFAKRKPTQNPHFFTMGVDFERESEAALKMLDELKVKSILVRIGLWELEKLPKLQAFLEKNQNRHIVCKIMQDREHIEDLQLLKNDLKQIFIMIKADIFEIGTTINRAKWGFFSVDEYLRFYKVAYDLKKERFKDIRLIGSGVIDFEFHWTAHTLFNFCRCRYDGISALLYVDRRGAPENTQLGFNLSDKIALLSSLVTLSPKTDKHIYLTETNWPLSGTAPYAPTSEKECVDEKTYADYMVRYYLLAYASSQVDAVSWHQLIARGYGLVDYHDNKLRKRSAYYAYKAMLHHLQAAEFLRMDIKRGYYRIMCVKEQKLLEIHWSLVPVERTFGEGYEIFDIEGRKVKNATITIDESPHYIYDTKAVVA